MKKYSNLFIALMAGIFLVQCTEKYEQPELEARKAKIISEGNYQFKDLNKNGTLDPYEDWRLPVEDRLDNLVSLMTLEEKIGLMFHPNIAVPVDGVVKYDLTEEEKAALEKAEEERYAGPIGPGGNNPQEVLWPWAR
jgi:hypothetical protein